jgi:DNA-binding XRE family transcriptional regulator
MTDTIERGGRRFVLVPEKTYARMVEDLDMLADIKAYDRVKGKPQEFVPAALVDRLIAGENRLKVWREHRGLTQAALAKKAGISEPYLSQLEHGSRAPSLAVLKALAEALALDLDDLAP